MITELEPGDFARIQAILPRPGIHLALESILAGSTPARVFVDSASRPGTALVWSKNHFYLAGATSTPDFNTSLNALFNDRIYPERLAAGAVMLELFSAAAVHWAQGSRAEVTRPNRFDGQAQAILAGKDILPDRREYYQVVSAEVSDPILFLPAGFQLVPVDRSLLDRKELRGLAHLEEELASERPSPEDFLAKSFGVALIKGTELAGWCLSEYNTLDRCEVGIETVEPYRRSGLGTLLGKALVVEAARRGIASVGWHCFAWNTASTATALKIGFKKIADYPIYFAWYHKASNLAVHGNIYLNQGLYSEALDWFKKASVCGDAPAWADWGAGCACARLGDHRTAFRWLSQAIEKGYSDATAFAESEHLASLRQSPEWMILTNKLHDKSTS